jgi:hypothetical protein
VQRRGAVVLMADVFPLRHLALVLDALIELVEGGP